MASFGKLRPPIWFYVIGVLLLLWGAMGVYAFYADVTMSAADLAKLPAYDQRLLASRPVWFPWLYGASVWSGLIGSALLLARSAHARWLFIVSLITVVVMFGFIFIATDLIAVKGVGVAMGFPVFIFAICVLEVWLSGHAIKRRWIG
ncbi:hypothetical protein [Sphingomonas immobilis]|uniref:Sugar transporter n=1 Tax=Sphingomonas immobilis TaxID=3063997 RepID=A0ABT8ZU87_9SPHN|nr:hypothetical protein [Sphingomonas sp. CA1-15]MDO7841135.1 hypothetical protein [Sphingomonas sp. CA1-15]